MDYNFYYTYMKDMCYQAFEDASWYDNGSTVDALTVM